MFKAIIFFMLVGTFMVFEHSKDLRVWTPGNSVQEVLHELGEPLPKHFIGPTQEEVKKGEELVNFGRTIGPNGKLTKYISKYYVCTTCHNLEREDPDLRESNPETRLPYVKRKGLPFLQGTTFKGIVNRESWYNDDYVKKYGDEKIEIAHKDLRESIQLCAVECSQGRLMESWEIEAVLAYYWTLEFTLEDLGLNVNDLDKLNTAFKKGNDNRGLINWLKSFYLQKSPAHFYDAPPNKHKGYEGLTGNPVAGKDLYEMSCLHCHKPGGVSHYILEDSKLDFKHLRKMMTKDSHFSLYQLVAYGTYAIPGHRPYMPHYPLERLSKQQVEDLRAYIEIKAE